MGFCLVPVLMTLNDCSAPVYQILVISRGCCVTITLTKERVIDPYFFHKDSPGSVDFSHIQFVYEFAVPTLGRGVKCETSAILVASC